MNKQKSRQHNRHAKKYEAQRHRTEANKKRRAAARLKRAKDPKRLAKSKARAQLAKERYWVRRDQRNKAKRLITVVITPDEPIAAVEAAVTA